MPNGLQGKVIVITGASSGFGKGSALRFAQAGCCLVLAARRQDALDEVVQEIGAPSCKALAVPTDVAQPEEVKQLAAGAVLEFGRIDVWINNAGVGALGLFDEVPLEDHTRVIQTDLLGALYGSYYALHHFRERAEGILMNISSVAGKIPPPYYASYSAAKAGLVALGASIRQELRENHLDGIHVCTVLPTSFDTPFFDHAANYTGKETNPIPPVYDPEKVVDAIFRLATHPQDEISVGSAAKIALVAHQVAPHTTENLMGDQTQKAQIRQAAPGPKTPGAVKKPIRAGRGITGEKDRKAS